MKSNIIRSIAAMAFASLALVSCQTPASAPSKDAVMCDKCKTVWVKRSESLTTGTKGGPGYVVYRDAKAMQCPECESNVETFFKTGSLKHRCAHCGGAISHCEHQ